MSDILIAHLKQSVALVANQAPMLVGFSGGLDSSVLLHLLRAQLPERSISAIHVNHGLSPHADQWQEHCRQWADALGVSFVAERVNVRQAGSGLEDAARAARYSAFAKHLPKGGILLLGHHGDDQAETVLLRLLRGAGPKGLAAMEPLRVFEQGYLLRPLLAVSRSDLERYARDHQLDWIEDESNHSDQFDRNFLRNEVMPRLLQRWPSCVETINRNAQLVRQYDQLAEILASEDCQDCGLKPARVGQYIDISRWRQWPAIRRANALRYLLRQQHLPEPSQAIMAQIDNQFFASNPRPDSNPVVTWGGVSVRLYDEKLYFVANPQDCQDRLEHALAGTTQTHQEQQQHAVHLSWSGQAPLSLPGGGELILKPGGHFAWQGEALTVGFRQGGERAQPFGRAHSQTLKKLLQEYKLEPWLRSCVPIIHSSNQIAAVGDVWIEQAFYEADENQGYRIEWRPGTGKI